MKIECMFFKILKITLLIIVISTILTSCQHKIKYPDGRLKYQGGWENNSENGNGRSYFANGTLEYEGEWKNGKYNGEGKKYNDDGKIIYEGSWENGKYDGEGKKYDDDGNIVYEGAWINEKKNGFGKLFFGDGKINYEGNFLNDKYNGKGKEYSPNGSILFDGEYTDGLKNGYGKLYSSSGIIEREGKWENNNLVGQGKEYFSNGKIKYEGEFKENNYEGTGIKYFQDGTIAFKGQFKNNKSFIELSFMHSSDISQYSLTSNGEEFLIARGEYNSTLLINENKVGIHNRTRFGDKCVDDVIWDGNRYVGFGRESWENNFFISKDGVKWEKMPYIEQKEGAMVEHSKIFTYKQVGFIWPVWNIVYVNNKYICIAWDGAMNDNITFLASSTDLKNWDVTRFSFELYVFLEDLTFGDGKYVAVGTDIYFSENAVNWTELKLDSKKGLDLKSIAYGNDMFLCVGKNCIYTISKDMQTIEEKIIEGYDFNCVKWNGNAFIIVGAKSENNAVIATTQNGKDIEIINTNIEEPLNEIEIKGDKVGAITLEEFYPIKAFWK